MWPSLAPQAHFLPQQRSRRSWLQLENSKVQVSWSVQPKSYRRQLAKVAAERTAPQVCMGTYCTYPPPCSLAFCTHPFVAIHCDAWYSLCRYSKDQGMPRRHE